MIDDQTADRFFKKVVKMESGCHEWSGSKDSQGYGFFSVGGRTVKAHRASYIIASGTDIPSNVCVCHSCDNPSCVNPEHLWLGSQADNVADRSAKGRTSRKGAPPTLPESEVAEAMRMLASGDYSISEVAARFGVSKSLISAIRKGKIRKSVGQSVDLSATDNFKKQRRDGHHNPNAKLTPDNVAEIFTLRAIGFSQQKIADRFGVSQTCVSRVLRSTP